MLITRVSVDTHHPVVLQGGEERPTVPMNQLKISDRSTSRRRTATVEKDSSGFELFMSDKTHKHFVKVVILGFTIRVRMINPVVDGPEVFVVSFGMDEIDQPDPFDCTVFITRVLSFDELD